MRHDKGDKKDEKKTEVSMASKRPGGDAPLALRCTGILNVVFFALTTRFNGL